MSKLRIGSIGGGGIASAHWPHLQAREDVELVALADVNPAAQETAQKQGIPQFFTDYREMLPQVDAVLICVPTHLHAEIAIDALNAKKAVFCEKPLARTLQQADTMAQAAAENDMPLQVGFVRRFDDAWLSWHDALQKDKIGRPVVWRDVAAGPGPTPAWFFRDEQGGGPFLDGCIHNFDFALHTFGPAQWVFCNAHTLNSEHTAIDTGTATVRFQSGDEMMLAWSWGLPSDVYGARVFEMLGPKGTFTWPESKQGEQRFVISNGVTNEESVLADAETTLTQGFKRQMDEFIAVARREEAPRAGVQEGRAALQLALAVLESGRSGKVVSF
jgi:myo-inositol 2-dehydrogenase/D-chiro-inositol 1-dehydrogenase